ncbi:BTAD domain-containing putative transcriptional regulator [Kitasatospora cheerisanensis]|uniref:OmpR/PhoB-type domain-containing protein n=1 Tax=Kitasatospora cheerisanensis KCTC 2395 TaxID=1348663 RepID=A0A066YV09_9ACTN|nr:BTAD domain-containing putative transcriptional regulator [Kitasatospora cheerisanensis]KDN81745.1 hypothetical protein KCH_64650 [Kitasatospora cheerisanensis KCTC 2395]
MGRRPARQGPASLQAYVSNLRRLLEPARGPRQAPRLLVSAGRGYALREVATDAEEFEALTEAGEPRRALALWHGDAYGEFADRPWAAAETARLDELRAAARESATGQALAAGRFGAAVQDATALTDAHPLREEGWRLLALALWHSGRQADALAAVRRARAHLAAELGLDPGPALAELETAILRQQLDRLALPAGPAGGAVEAGAPAGGGGAVGPGDSAGRGGSGTRGAAPVRPAGSAGGVFVGRQEELALLRRAAAAARGGVGFALVGGEAGAGKSTLLGRLAEELADGGWRVATGRCPESAGAPAAWAWTEVLRDLAALDPDTAADPETPAPSPRRYPRSTPTPRGSVVRGLSATGRVISSAAAIMVAVFTGFAIDPDITVKMIGVGMAVAVLIDASVVRLVLVPATMTLLGRHNWWLPGWLDRLLPQLRIEHGDAPAAPAKPPSPPPSDAPSARPAPRTRGGPLLRAGDRPRGPRRRPARRA